MDGDGDPVQIEISKTSRLGKAWYRFLEMMGFRRHVLGGFGRVRSGNCPFLLRCQVTVPPPQGLILPSPPIPALAAGGDPLASKAIRYVPGGYGTGVRDLPPGDPELDEGHPRPGP